MSASIDLLMKQAVERGVFPSAALAVGLEGKMVHQGYYGKARKGMCFDIASLTKPICTATLAQILIQEKKLNLSDTLAQWCQGAKQPVHKKITVGHLLTHTSGLPAWKPYYRELPLEAIGKPEAKEHILRSILEEPIFSQPGKIYEYSDLDYILLGEILEKAGGKPLDKLFYEKIAKPFGLKNTFFVREGRPTHGIDIPRRRFAPAEDCPWRGKVIQGEVHDHHAFAMGGVAGHAGLFATSSDIHRFVTAFLDSKIADYSGWDTPSFTTSSAGRYFSPNSIGHLGYTGCSLWIDLDKNFWVIVLTNRIHPSSANQKIKGFRPRLHNWVWKELMGQ